MKESLKVGIEHHKRYQIPANKTVPNLYPEAAEFVQMPEVFATGFLVGLLEWACIEAINPHINWPIEQTLGVDIKVSHQKANQVGDEILIDVKLTQIEGKRLYFEVKASDDRGIISQGTHQRQIIIKSQFEEKIATNQ